MGSSAFQHNCISEECISHYLCRFFGIIIPPAKHSAEYAGRGHVVLAVVTGDTVLQNFNACRLTGPLRFFCLPCRRPLASFIRYATSEGQWVVITSHCLQAVVLGGFSQEVTFSVPWSLPTKQVSQVLPPSPSSILSLPEAGLRKRWFVPGFCTVHGCPPLACTASVPSLSPAEVVQPAVHRKLQCREGGARLCRAGICRRGYATSRS